MDGRCFNDPGIFFSRKEYSGYRLEVRDLGRSLQQLPIANDVAKYFAIIPAAFASTYPQLRVLDVMHLTTPASAILSAVIFNAVIIVMLIPLALKGVKYRAIGAAALLRRNLLIYGLGGLILPFPCIKLIDMVLASLQLGVNFLATV